MRRPPGVRPGIPSRAVDRCSAVCTHRTPGARSTRTARELEKAVLLPPCSTSVCVSKDPDPAIVSPLLWHLCSLPCFLCADATLHCTTTTATQVHRAPHVSFFCFPFAPIQDTTPRVIELLVSLSNKQGTQQRPRAPPSLPFRTTAL